MSSCEFISLKEYYEVTVSLKMKAICLIKRTTLDRQTNRRKNTLCRQKSVLKYQPKWGHLSTGSQREVYVCSHCHLTVNKCSWTPWHVLRCQYVISTNWICDVISNACWYLDNLTVLIKPNSSGKLTRIIPQCRQGWFYSTQFKINY
jgi:hypothetical protein